MHIEFNENLDKVYHLETELITEDRYNTYFDCPNCGSLEIPLAVSYIVTEEAEIEVLLCQDCTNYSLLILHPSIPTDERIHIKWEVKEVNEYE